jgi:hypothetical protein
MPFLSVRDIRLHYEIRGTGPRLLFMGLPEVVWVIYVVE